MNAPYAELCARLREAATLYSVGNLLNWDQETMMPPAAAPFRADELALIGRLAHERATTDEIGELLERCEASVELCSDPRIAANLREIRRDYDRARKLSPDLVAEMSQCSSQALEVWKIARERSDFASFRPWLERQVELNRRKAECYGVPADGELYDALVEDYEPGMTGRRLEAVFEPLREDLTPLIAEIAAAGRAPGRGPLQVEIPIPIQQAFNAEVLAALGFDTRAGRLDVSIHPFSGGIAPHDTRITTRYRTTHFPEALSSTLHEAGHGLYEQGLPKEEHWGEPLGESLGLGIHESQSRLWENQVGRSREFWIWALPLARRVLGPPVAPFDVDDLFGAVNIVEPGLIRVESDEATYHLHVMLRFDIERALLRGDLAVRDVPAAWNDRMKRDLGLDVPDDAHGCLQDIHWSMGSLGYFPTYTLGSLYAAQFWNAATRECPGLESGIVRGEFAPLLQWLREKIHRRGRQLPADQLCETLTGEKLTHRPLMRHLRNKLEPLYGLS